MTAADRRMSARDAGSMLLRSARLDAPTDDARRAALAALGLLDGGAGGPRGTADGPAPTGAPTTSSLSLFAGAGTFVATAVALALAAMQRPSPATLGYGLAALLESTERVTAVADDELARPTPLRPQSPDLGVTPPASPGAPRPMLRPARGGAASLPAGRAEPSLERELALIIGARAAVTSGAPRRAIALLDQHTREFPRPALEQEAAVVRIRALASAGDRAAAVELARSFLENHPASPYSAAVESTLNTQPAADGVEP